ncbi:3'-5' exonuclease [Lignipirellula cremea]|uniref:Putative 3'-5' exonuclease related to the exonuclease domain of PolB n=1 Tax=Lignipirellula cremea TaxID=2528010 RepID=A0A518DU42_9BACT|nr:3'-5' exonuclease [Lignipirellula cremea]QDU95360.1 putative 3'-5' exonuclease related to the exonuclease domain of PolB [Lignipirellula cremea]
MSDATVRYLVFDIETAADGDLISKLRYSDLGLDPLAAIERYRAELMEKYDSDFIPYTFQVPVSIVVAKVAADFTLLDLVALDEPAYQSHVMTEHFWRGWEKYRRPTLVSFNGRSFDLPVLELSAFRYGVSVPGWFDMQSRSFEQPRNRYNVSAHLDLHDVMTNFGASRFTGGLNLAANILGKPGKMQIQGKDVQDKFNAGEYAEINDYCRCDVLDTYFVLLRSAVMIGQITLEKEQEQVHKTKAWLESHAEERPIFTQYLDSWGDWVNPWDQVPAPAARSEKA